MSSLDAEVLARVDRTGEFLAHEITAVFVRRIGCWLVRPAAPGWARDEAANGW